MNSNTNTPVSETETVAWSSTLASCLSDFPAIVHMLNTESLSDDPSALIAFMRDPTGSRAFYKILSSLNNICTVARDEIAINQAQLRIVND